MRAGCRGWGRFALRAVAGGMQVVPIPQLTTSYYSIALTREWGVAGYALVVKSYGYGL